MSLTTVLAIGGGIVGLSGLLLSVYVARRDRPSVELFAAPDDPARAEVQVRLPGERYFLVHARNRGRRPLSIERIWFQRRSTGKTRHLLTDRYDRGTQTLAEGQSLTWDITFSTVTPEDLELIVLESQDGRRFTGRYRRSAPPRWNT